MLFMVMRFTVKLFRYPVYCARQIQHVVTKSASVAELFLNNPVMKTINLALLERTPPIRDT